MEKVVVKFVNKEDVKSASKTFFQEYVPGLKLVARGNEMEIEFQNDAPQIMQTILDYEIEEMSCNDNIDMPMMLPDPDLIQPDTVLTGSYFEKNQNGRKRKN